MSDDYEFFESAGYGDSECDCGDVQCCGMCCTDCHDMPSCDDTGCTGCQCKCHEDEDNG